MERGTSMGVLGPAAVAAEEEEQPTQTVRMLLAQVAQAEDMAVAGAAVAELKQQAKLTLPAMGVTARRALLLFYMRPLIQKTSFWTRLVQILGLFPLTSLLAPLPSLP